MSLAPDWRQRVEEAVRPLYAGLDGVDTFPRVTALERGLRQLTEGIAHDPELLELLALYHGVVPRLGRLDAGGRWQLFLGGLGASRELVSRLRRGLERFAEAPATPEEALLHDAVLLERTGVRAALARLLEAGRRRRPLDRALAELDAGPGPDRFHTPRAREIAAGRHDETSRWIAAVRSAAEER
jgi:hypothetical protein